MAVIIVVALFTIAVMKLCLVWVMLKHTWYWTHLGRSLLAMTASLAAVWLSIGVARLVGGRMPSLLLLSLTMLVMGSMVYLAYALRTHGWPLPPDRIQWASLLGLSREAIPPTHTWPDRNGTD